VLNIGAIVLSIQIVQSILKKICISVYYYYVIIIDSNVNEKAL